MAAKSVLEGNEDKIATLSKKSKAAETGKKEAETKLGKWKRKGEGFVKAQRRQIIVDQGGATTAQAVVEISNWLIRIGAEHSTGWWARNSDFLQSIPHTVLGSILYIAEMMLRNPEEAPTGWNQYGATMGLVWQHLGLNNLWNAIRGRIVEGKDTQQVTQAQLEAAKAEIAALRKRVGGT